MGMHSNDYACLHMPIPGNHGFVVTATTHAWKREEGIMVENKHKGQLIEGKDSDGDLWDLYHYNCWGYGATSKSSGEECAHAYWDHAEILEYPDGSKPGGE